MKPKLILGVPAQEKGGFHDTESQKQCNLPEINTKFNTLKDRFFSINKWKNYSGSTSADFKHFDTSGKPTARAPVMGDYIRITVANDDDWVEIINISHYNSPQYEYFLMTCRPSKDPNESKKSIDHFYSDSATSTMIISKEKDVLKVGIYGRNETPNLNNSFFNNIKNLFIALGGMIGFGKLQWKELSDGLLDFN